LSIAIKSRTKSVCGQSEEKKKRPFQAIAILYKLSTLRPTASLLDERRLSCEFQWLIEMSVEYTDAPASQPAPTEAAKMPCPFCGHLLPKNAEKCDRCDWTRGATETAEGKASDAVAVILSVIPGLGHIYKGHRLAGFLWMAGAIPVGIFVLLAAIASAGFGIGLFFFYLIAVMLHAYAVDDRIVPPREDEGEEY
jgi:hypothetical protein